MKILLFDGMSILHRAFYAMPPLTNAHGEYTNAVFGFLNTFFKFVDEEAPDYIIVAFDLPEPTFRHVKFEDYKGTRSAMPDELSPQIPVLMHLLSLMGVPVATCAGYEADDILGSLAKKAEADKISAVIITGDRDMLQLASDTVKIRIPKSSKGKTWVEDYFAHDVHTQMGVTPKEYIDVKALMGDASDNIPGVPSIGEKTALKLIQEYGSIENALAAIDAMPKRSKAYESLLAHRDLAFLSRELATIVTDVPVDLTLVGMDDYYNADAYDEIKRLELRSLYKRFETANPEVKHTDIKPPLTYRIVESETDAQVAINAMKGITSVYSLWDDYVKPPMLVSVTMVQQSCEPIVFVAGRGMSAQSLMACVKPCLESDDLKIFYDAKTDKERFDVHGVVLGKNVFDVMLASYVVDVLAPNNTISDAANQYLNERIPDFEEVLGNKGRRGKDRRSIVDLQPEEIAAYGAGMADALLRLRSVLHERIIKQNQLNLYHDIEIPLLFALADMETVGVQVSKSNIAEYGDVLDARIETLTKEIFALAGEVFNLNSPSQLGQVLFEKLGLPGGKKNTQGYSTAAEVLDKLTDAHPVIPLVKEYRAHTKLKSTYVDGLLPLIDDAGRIHSTFKQAVAATGRLSSTEPNLQNIPVRTALGRELRKAFIAKPGCVLIDADYSQIELRVLAHISKDETFITAFKENQDIHAITASQVFHVAPEAVTPLMRSNAKAVNFGIVYGISAFGLSQDLNISVTEAQGYIQGYFKKYPGVKQYLDDTILKAKHDGYVSTLYNRRRNMPELKSSNFNNRSFGERVAMNMPIQGAAADIIKIAMINVANRLIKENLQTKLVLQIHDELLLEAPLAEVDVVQKLLKEEMESAASLLVPLVVDINVGDSWYDTK